MPPVKGALLLVSPRVGQDASGNPPILDVGNAGDHDAAMVEQIRVLLEDAPRVNEVFNDIPIDGAVRPAAQSTLDLAAFDGRRIAHQNAVDNSGGLGGFRLADFDADITRIAQLAFQVPTAAS